MSAGPHSSLSLHNIEGKHTAPRKNPNEPKSFGLLTEGMNGMSFGTPSTLPEPLARQSCQK